MSIFGIDLLRRALQSQQRGMEVAGHNIANVNTPGYTRQEAILSTMPASGAPSREGTTLLLGSGVTVSGVRQHRDDFIERQIRQQQQTLNEWQVRQDFFRQIEGIFPEPSESGLGTMLSRFWSAWQELSLNPDSTAARTALSEEAQTLAAAIRQADQQLDDLGAQLDAAAVGYAGQINEIAQEIASLNTQITHLEVGGQRANDLRDRRQVLLEELTGLADVNAAETSTGELMVYLQGRQVVGPGGTTSAIQVIDNGPGVAHTFEWPDGGSLQVSRGQLAATLTTRDTEVASLKSDLDSLAGGLISEINTLHATGFTLTTPAAAGGDFFVGSGAADIDARADIKTDPQKIAASATGEVGDGSVAMQIAQLRLSRVMNGGTATIDDVYRGLVANVGVQGREAGRQVKNQQLLADQLRVRREASSGVSIDEEMTSMLRYQRAYEAAARMLQTVDRMTELLLNMLGR